MSNHVRFEARGLNFSCSSTAGERIVQAAKSTPKWWFGPTRETIAMETKQLIDVRVARQFSVPPKRLFDAWTDSKTAGKWLFAAGQSSCVEIDARAGGWFYSQGGATVRKSNMWANISSSFGRTDSCSRFSPRNIPSILSA
jgi:activator of Hsp90 ATPase-like protein